MKCTPGRRSSAYRVLCAHERYVVLEAQKIDQEEAPATVHEIGGGRSIADEERAIEIDGDRDGDADELDEDRIRRETKKREEMCYVATLPRRITPCESDYTESLGLLFGVAGAKLLASNADKGDSGKEKEDDEEFHVVQDSERECMNCARILSCTRQGINWGIRLRRVQIHTVMHGTIVAVVADLTCGYFHQVTVFDGHDRARFTGSHSVTR